MRHYKSILHFRTLGLAFVLALPIMANAAQYSHEDFRFPREQSTTKDGYPTPLSGKPITKTPVIVKKEGASPSRNILSTISRVKNPLLITRCESLY